MKKSFLLFIPIVFMILSCHSNIKDSTVLSNQLPFKQKEYSVDSINFFDSCSSVVTYSSWIGLQGTDASLDSTTYLCLADNYNAKKTYELIGRYKSTIESQKAIGRDSLFHIFNNACSNSFADFECYAFVFPMTEPEPGECTDKNGEPIACSIGINFPVNIKAYYRVHDNDWISVGNKIANRFEELSSFEFKTVYGNPSK